MVSRTISVAPNAHRRDWFWAAFLACSLAAMAPLWSVRYLPMTDLPQHAVMLSIWQHLNDPQYGFRDRFVLNPFTPYWGSYSVARALASFTSVHTALKLVVSLAVLAFPLSLVFLFQRQRIDRWWALVGFVLAFGHAFYFGFFNFLLAVPLGIVFIALALSYAEAPRLRGGLVMALAFLGLFLAHGMILLFGTLIFVALVFACSPDMRALPARWLPLGPAWLVSIGWTSFRSSHLKSPVELGFGWYRLAATTNMIGYSYNPGAWMVVCTLFALIIHERARGRRPLHLYIPLACAAGFVFFWPQDVLAIQHVAFRFTMLLIPFTVLALAPAARSGVRRALALFVVGWLGWTAVRFQRFDADARDYDVIQASMGWNKSLRPLIFEPTNAQFGEGTPFLHFPLWTQAEKGGISAFSFASVFQNIVNYRPDAALPIDSVLERDHAEYSPALFRWSREPGFDYYVVRSSIDRSAALFGEAGPAVTLLARQGKWWLYGRGATRLR
jgi:hypothetical protein